MSDDTKYIKEAFYTSRKLGAIFQGMQTFNQKYK